MYIDPFDTPAARLRDETVESPKIIYRPSKLTIAEVDVIIARLAMAIDEELFRLNLTEATSSHRDNIEFWLLGKIANHLHFGCWSERVRADNTREILEHPIVRDFIFNVTATCLQEWSARIDSSTVLLELIRWVLGGIPINGSGLARSVVNPEAAASINVDYGNTCVFLEANPWYLVYYIIVQNPNCLARYKAIRSAGLELTTQPKGEPN